MTDEQYFHQCLDTFALRADSWARPMSAARACLNLGFATLEEMKKNRDLQDHIKLAYPAVQAEIKNLTTDQAWDYLISYCSKPFKDSDEMFWCLFCIEDRDWHGYPSTEEYVRSQPFEVLEQWIAFLKEWHMLDDLVEENTFETLKHYKHYTPEWDERFKALVPGWEPYNPED